MVLYILLLYLHFSSHIHNSSTRLYKLLATLNTGKVLKSVRKDSEKLFKCYNVISGVVGDGRGGRCCPLYVIQK